MPRTSAAAVTLVCLAACGGGGSSSPTPPAGNQTETFTGSSSVSATGGCSAPGQRHVFASGQGTVVVTLVQSGDNAAVSIQVCPQNKVNDAQCSIPPFARIGVGQSARATLIGGPNQEVNVYPATCGQVGTFPASTVTYTVTVEHPR